MTDTWLIENRSASLRHRRARDTGLSALTRLSLPIYGVPIAGTFLEDGVVVETYIEHNSFTQGLAQSIGTEMMDVTAVVAEFGLAASPNLIDSASASLEGPLTFLHTLVSARCQVADGLLIGNVPST